MFHVEHSARSLLFDCERTVSPDPRLKIAEIADMGVESALFLRGDAAAVGFCAAGRESSSFTGGMRLFWEYAMGAEWREHVFSYNTMML